MTRNPEVRISQARSQGGKWGQFPPPSNSENCTQKFQIHQAFDVSAKQIRQWKLPKLLKETYPTSTFGRT